jgi:hypothetical protein
MKQIGYLFVHKRIKFVEFRIFRPPVGIAVVKQGFGFCPFWKAQNANDYKNKEQDKKQ